MEVAMAIPADGPSLGIALQAHEGAHSIFPRNYQAVQEVRHLLSDIQGQGLPIPS